MTKLTTSNRPRQNISTLLPSAAGSVLLHGLLVVAVSLFLRGCQKAQQGQSGGEVFRDVGLFVTDGVDGGAADSGEAVGGGRDSMTQPKSPDASNHSNLTEPSSNNGNQMSQIPTEAPDISSLINNSSERPARPGDNDSSLPSLIGPGFTLGGGSPGSTPAGGGQLIRPSEAGGAAKVGGTGGPGSTTFMSVAGTGQSFVYVVDTSSSMTGLRLQVAQSQLKSSLRLLLPSQKFAVVTYNEAASQITLGRLAPQDMYFATDRNKFLAESEINKLISTAGTRHAPALLMALKLRPDPQNPRVRPDVIYFLTDGEESPLPGELREIMSSLGSTTVHVIQFTDGTLTSRETSWLERVANSSGGEFRRYNTNAKTKSPTQ